MWLNMNIFTIFVLLIPIIDSQTIFTATISNSTGYYYVSQNDSDFVNGEINCNSDQLCHIKCSHSNSCNNINVYCNNPNLCIMDCDGSTTCQGLRLYIGSKNNTIDCVGYESCKSQLSSDLTTYIYTDYKNSPSSNAILTCSNSFSCNWMHIEDISGRPGYTDSTKFKILCVDVFGGCELSLYSAKPLAIPSIVNSTGEYYFGIGSYLTIACSHNLLCHINCGEGGCQHSNINCGDADECVVLCQGSGDSPCYMMDITAQNNKQFDVICSGGHWACEDSNFYIANVNNAHIDCSAHGSWNCEGTKFKVNSVTNVEVECDGFSWPCGDMSWDVDMVENFTAKCYDCSDQLDFKINNTKYFDFICDGSDFYTPCSKMVIASYGSNEELNVHCVAGKSCKDSQICIEDGNMFDLDCCGDHSCNDILFCNKAHDNLTTINCDCGGIDTCINMTTEFHNTSSNIQTTQSSNTFGLQCNGFEAYFTDAGLITAIPSDVCISIDSYISYMLKCDNINQINYYVYNSSDCSGDKHQLSVVEAFGLENIKVINTVCNKQQCEYSKIKIYNTTFKNMSECQAFNREHGAFTEEIYINGYCTSISGSVSLSATCDEDSNSVITKMYIGNDECVDNDLTKVNKLNSGENNQCVSELNLFGIDFEDGQIVAVDVSCGIGSDSTANSEESTVTIIVMTGSSFILICLLIIIWNCVWKKRGLNVFGIGNFLINTGAVRIELNAKLTNEQETN